MARDDQSSRTDPVRSGSVGLAGSGRDDRADGVERPRGMLAQLRIRKKLILLHTVFSVLLAGLLLAVLRPTVNAVVERAEFGYAAAVLERDGVGEARAGARWENDAALVEVVRGTPAEIGLPKAVAAVLDEGGVVRWGAHGQTGAVRMVGDGSGSVEVVWVTMPEVRRVAIGVFVFVAVALLVVYASVAGALEVFVLPRHVYAPIRRMLEADRAVQTGRGGAGGELIPDRYIPADELGEIMRSRNASVLALREHERRLASALSELESVANDLRRKNHLIEAARRNLADTDRLASLGVMSAGIAHEMNTPLSVAKGLVDKLGRSGGSDSGTGLTAAEIGLLSRVIGRLERVSEGLLDFARVRPPELSDRSARDLVAEAITLVGLDRSGGVRLLNRVPGDLGLRCDADRVVQVLVNLVRNAAEAASEGPAADPTVTVSGEGTERDGQEWVSLVIQDNGAGIDPELLPTLFEPFVSSRLDSHGTGLGLAVSMGIVQEHGGVLLARNRTEPGGRVVGAEFEVLLPGPGEPTSTQNRVGTPAPGTGDGGTVGRPPMRDE